MRSELDSLKEKIASTSGCVGGYVGGHVTSKDVSSSAISGDMFRRFVAMHVHVHVHVHEVLVTLSPLHSKLQRSDVITSLQRELADVKSILGLYACVHGHVCSMHVMSCDMSCDVM